MNASANTEERPFAAVLSSIVGNLQDIVRSDIRLLKTEAGEELKALTSGAGWLVGCILSAFFAVCFVLGAAFFALLRVLSDWEAALVMAAGLAVLGAVTWLVYRVKAKAAKSKERSS